ncbi:hypothetical protein DH2020_046913 [Rehmannia glutinosa]|uniref:Haloacid dehalogenase-like hydrolase domain-containing protein n=1 Tax=Rehmannia glutinosa TaxID=99300 RepID=A0ABR0UA35_REHGL
MPALHLFTHFLPNIHPLHATPFSSRKNLSTNPPNFSLRMSSSSPRHSLLASVAPLEAILFDIDGTLVGFNGGEPISEEFFIKNLSGMHNEELCHVLFPDWDIERSRKFLEDKEAMFRRLAAEQLKPVTGLDKLCKWVDDNGFKRAAVTNAPRENAEMMISLLGLGEFFELLIDSVSGINAGVAAGMPVVGLATRNPESLLSEAGATMVIKDYTDSKLWAALEDLAKKTGEVEVTA